MTVIRSGLKLAEVVGGSGKKVRITWMKWIHGGLQGFGIVLDANRHRLARAKVCMGIMFGSIVRCTLHGGSVLQARD